jgi:hypothetical protein
MVYGGLDPHEMYTLLVISEHILLQFTTMLSEFEQIRRYDVHISLGPIERTKYTAASKKPCPDCS